MTTIKVRIFSNEFAGLRKLSGLLYHLKNLILSIIQNFASWAIYCAKISVVRARAVDDYA